MATSSKEPKSSQMKGNSLFGDLFGEDDESYQEIKSIDPADDDEYNDPSVAPSYLLTAILAGLYEIPPFHILRHQTGWGRRIRYDPEKLVRLKPDFRRVGMLSVEHGTDVILEEMVLQRYSFTDDKRSVAKDFCIYRVRVQNPDKLNQELKIAAQEEQTLCPHGLDVSNAGGGWHGRPHFFQKERKLYRICVDIIGVIEQRQRLPTRLQLEPRDIECWVNISGNGSWNRLHTHEGSMWSGVYYVDNGNVPSNHYGGRMVLKPTTHPKEDTYTLSESERERFLNNVRTLQTMDLDGCEYLEIDPVPGHMIIFPGWLHHCVLPISHLEPHSRRISIAFNINSSKVQVTEDSKV